MMNRTHWSVLSTKDAFNPELNLNCHYKMHVIVVRSPSKIVVSPELDYMEFNWMSSNMQFYYNKPANQIPISFGVDNQMNLPCVVRFHGVWMRGYANNIGNNRIHVRGMDSDISGIFDDTNVIKLSAEYQSSPLKRYCVSLSNITPAYNATWNFDSCMTLGRWLANRSVLIQPLADIDCKQPMKHYIGLIEVDFDGRGYRDLGSILIQEGLARTSELEGRILPVETGTDEDVEEGYSSE